MAIKNKPSWDLSAAEIQKRVDALPVLDRAYFARQQTRADSAASEHDAVRETLDRLSKTLTAVQMRDLALEISPALRSGATDEVLAALARADANTRTTGDGLIQTTVYDASNRPIHTFKSIDGRKHWMNPYRGLAGLQIALTNNTTNTHRQAQRYLAAHPEAELL